MPKLSLSHICVCQLWERVIAIMFLRNIHLTPELKMSMQVKPSPMEDPCVGLDMPMLVIRKTAETTATTKRAILGPAAKCVAKHSCHH